MADIMADTLVTTPRKRTHDGELVPHNITTPQAAHLSNSGTTPSQRASPAPSNATSDLTELTSHGLASPGQPGLNAGSCITANDDAQVKKRKLTFAEKEVERAVRQREREEKARQKAEEKVRKDEEKRQKDEDRRKREEEKELAKRAKELAQAEKKKARDADKQEKEAEKQRRDAEKKEKEEEKLKREKSQLRIGAFFGRPAAQTTPPTTPGGVSSGASSRRSSIADVDVPEDSVKSDVSKPANPDFEKYIIPYFVHEHTELAPINRFRATGEARGHDDGLSFDVSATREQINTSLRIAFGPRKKRLRLSKPVKDLVDQVQIKHDGATIVVDDYSPLDVIPYKILAFREDVRPPYVGTYTKIMSEETARRLSRKPFHRGRTDTNYDYDSEAEWEEPAADDEEILDDEMSESEDGDEEMQDFLDDEEDHGRKRLFAVEMEPISSGLCFQGESYDSKGHNLESYRMDVLHDSVTFPIDPYSTAHWTDTLKTAPTKAKLDTNARAEPPIQSETVTKAMPPPRVPLSTMSSSNSMVNYLSPNTVPTTSTDENAIQPAKQRGRAPNPGKELKMIPDEFMVAFKQAVQGSDLTKAGLIEILKKQFPKCSKDAIKDTLGVIAVRVGKKEAEKKWSLVE